MYLDTESVTPEDIRHFIGVIQTQNPTFTVVSTEICPMGYILEPMYSGCHVEQFWLVTKLGMLIKLDVEDWMILSLFKSFQSYQDDAFIKAAAREGVKLEAKCIAGFEIPDHWFEKFFGLMP